MVEKIISLLTKPTSIGGAILVMAALGLSACAVENQATASVTDTPHTATVRPSPTPPLGEPREAGYITERAVVRQGYIPIPVAMAFAPGSPQRLFYTEKGGRVRLIEDLETVKTPVLSLPTDSDRERGLLGISIDPNFRDNHYIWVFYSALPDDPSGSVENRILRFTEEDGVAVDPQIALSIPVPANRGSYNGGNLHFGPDGMLYVSLGDHNDTSNPQNLDVRPGKIHRFIADVPLGIPDDNPFPGSSIYAYGLRNSFDFTFDPVTGALFATENGPHCQGEVNLIVAGGNYGWGTPGNACDLHERDEANQYEAPLWSLDVAEGLTGIVFYEHERIPQWQGKLLICAWNTGIMRVATLNETRDRIVSVEEVDLGNTECQTDVRVGPDGRVYYMSAERIWAIADVSYQLESLNMSRFEVGGQTARFDDQAALFNESGMRWVKIQQPWQPGASGADVSSQIEAAHIAGLKVLLSIAGPAYPTEINFDEFLEFLGEAVSHKPDAVEIWADMNLDRGWPAGQISAEDYVQNMLAPSYDLIKSFHRDVMVISGGLGPTGAFGGCTENGCDDSAYAQAMAVAGAEDFADCIGVRFESGATSPAATTGHPFDGGGGHYSWYYSSMADLYGSTFSRPLCFTSLGYLAPEGYGEVSGNFAWAADTTVAQQAEWLGEAVALARDAGNVRMLIVFNMDLEQFSPEDPQAAYAILRPDGSCPACESIAAALPEATAD